MEETARRWRPDLWQVSVAAIAALLIAAWVALLAVRRHDEHAWAATVPALEAAGFVCRVEAWAATVPAVDEARQDRLWAALAALPDITEKPDFAAWLAGKAGDVGDEVRRSIAEHAAAVTDIDALVRDGARCDLAGWVAADLARGRRPPANRFGNLLAARSVATWLRLAALVERSPARLADLDRWAAAHGRGTIMDAMIALTVGDVRDRTRLDALRAGVPIDDACVAWLDEPTHGRDLLRTAWAGERCYGLACTDDALSAAALRVGMSLSAVDPRWWWQWAVLPDGRARIARWYAEQEAAMGGPPVPTGIPAGIGGAGSFLYTISIPNLGECTRAVSQRCCAARMTRLAARLVTASRADRRVPTDQAEAAARIAPAAFDADDETCAVRYARCADGWFRLEADLASPPKRLPPPHRVVPLEVPDALRAPAATGD